MLDVRALATTELTQGLESLRNRVATDPFCAPFARASWPRDAGLQCKYFASCRRHGLQSSWAGRCGARYRPGIQHRMRPDRLIEIIDPDGIYPLPSTSGTSPGRTLLSKPLARIFKMSGWWECRSCPAAALHTRGRRLSNLGVAVSGDLLDHESPSVERARGAGAAPAQQDSRSR